MDYVVQVSIKSTFDIRCASIQSKPPGVFYKACTFSFLLRVIPTIVLPCGGKDLIVNVLSARSGCFSVLPPSYIAQADLLYWYDREGLSRPWHLLPITGEHQCAVFRGGTERRFT